MTNATKTLSDFAMKHLMHNDNREEYRQDHLKNLMESGFRSYCRIGNTMPPGCLSVDERSAWMQGNKKAKATAKAVFKK